MIEPFINRWQNREGGQERANYVMFLNEFCQALGLPIPEPSGATTRGSATSEAMRPAATGPRTVFPPGDLGQTAAVMASLAHASGPVSSAAIAACFRQGRRIQPAVEAVLAALVWDGWVSQASGSAGFVLRRAA